MEKHPFIIVGFGIAGATMAWQLYLKNIPFMVVASPINTCSRAAAGMINPIVFRRFNMSWMASDLMPEADEFYNKVQDLLQAPIRRNHPIAKVFTSVEDENDWMVKKTSSAYKDYFGQVESLNLQDVNTPYGIGVVNTIGHLNTGAYLNLSSAFFKNNGVNFIEEDFDYSRLKDNLYGDVKLNKVIFCEGYGLKKNPFFNYLPLNGTHGDTLIIKAKDFDYDKVLNKNMYVLPIAKNTYKIGASINWDKKEPETTESGKQFLLEKLKSFASFDFEIIEQQAGVRPTVKDRRPLVGMHPRHTELAIFNGLGTKGVMLAPYFANQLLAHLLEAKPLNDEVNIVRFEKYLP